MGVFRFKKFSVLNEKSAMKVNTDGVLLGAALTLPAAESPCSILDIGTGTGTIALILAQRFYERDVTVRFESPEGAAPRRARILGIDIDQPSAEEAGYNFASSPWAESLSVRGIPLSVLESEEPESVYDLIASNPPYFDDSLQNPDPRESAARHSLSLSYREIASFAAKHLSPCGLLALILPADVEKALVRHCFACGLAVSRIIRIRTSERKPFKRIIAEFRLASAPAPASALASALASAPASALASTPASALASAEYPVEVITIGSETYHEIVSPFYL